MSQRLCHTYYHLPGTPVWRENSTQYLLIQKKHRKPQKEFCTFGHFFYHTRETKRPEDDKRKYEMYFLLIWDSEGCCVMLWNHGSSTSSCKQPKKRKKLTKCFLKACSEFQADLLWISCSLYDEIELGQLVLLTLLLLLIQNWKFLPKCFNLILKNGETKSHQT